MTKRAGRALMPTTGIMHTTAMQDKKSAETEAETTSKKQEGAEGGLDTAACTMLWGYALRYTLLQQWLSQHEWMRSASCGV